jgi:exosome complex exonuclease DIS3/RRP44
VVVSGFERVNRAMEGDLVAVEILPFDQWGAAADKRGGYKSGGGGKAADDDAEEDEGGGGAEVAEPTAAPSMGDLENATARPRASQASASSATLAPQAAGRVVAIVRRAWKHYCGSIAQHKADEALVRVAGFLVEKGAFVMPPVESRNLIKKKGAA